MIHWARQIKEVLNTQDAFEMAETSGPLEEIQFWKNRCQDLSGISSQLDKPGVKKIEQILDVAKSSYVVPFRKLSSQIKVGFFFSVNKCITFPCFSGVRGIKFFSVFVFAQNICCTGRQDTTFC